MYRSKKYLINGEPVDKRGIAAFLYGNDTAPPPKHELEQRVVDFFERGFNATDIEIMSTKTWK